MQSEVNATAFPFAFGIGKEENHRAVSEQIVKEETSIIRHKDVRHRQQLVGIYRLRHIPAAFFFLVRQLSVDHWMRFNQYLVLLHVNVFRQIAAEFVVTGDILFRFFKRGAFPCRRVEDDLSAFVNRDAAAGQLFDTVLPLG